MGKVNSSIGNSKDWDLLATVTQETASRSVLLPFASLDKTEYDYFLIVGNVEMSAADWLYVSTSSSSVQEGKYFTYANNDGSYSSINFNANDYPIFLFQKVSGTTYAGEMANVSQNSKYKIFTFDLANNLYFICYSNSKSITTNSQVKIYGKKKLLEV